MEKRYQPISKRMQKEPNSNGLQPNSDGLQHVSTASSLDQGLPRVKVTTEVLVCSHWITVHVTPFVRFHLVSDLRGSQSRAQSREPNSGEQPPKWTSVRSPGHPVAPLPERPDHHEARQVPGRERDPIRAQVHWERGIWSSTTGKGQ